MTCLIVPDLARIDLISFIVAGMFWICVESVDKAGVFVLLLSSVYTELKPFLLLTISHQRAG